MSGDPLSLSDCFILQAVEYGLQIGRQGKLGEDNSISTEAGRTIIPLTAEQLGEIGDCLTIAFADGSGTDSANEYSVKVDCGTCTFDGGDIQNWRKTNGGCASAGTADARILVNAGRFVIGDPKGENDNIFEVEDGGQVFIPADSKALFNQKLTNSGFLPDGYRTKKNADGWYEVCEKLGMVLFIR